MRTRIQGTVREARRVRPDANPNSFIIDGDDGNTYFAHIGDLQVNQDILFGNTNSNTLFLEEGDRVEFDIVTETPWEHAIHVIRINRLFPE